MNKRNLIAQMRPLNSHSIRVQLKKNVSFYEVDINVDWSTAQLVSADHAEKMANSTTTKSLADASSQKYISCSMYLFEDDSDSNCILRAAAIVLVSGPNIFETKASAFMLEMNEGVFDEFWRYGESMWPITSDFVSMPVKAKIQNSVEEIFAKFKGTTK